MHQREFLRTLLEATYSTIGDSLLTVLSFTTWKQKHLYWDSDMWYTHLECLLFSQWVYGFLHEQQNSQKCDIFSRLEFIYHCLLCYYAWLTFFSWLGWIFPRSQEGTRDGEYAYYYCIFITWYEQGRMQQLHVRVHVHVCVWTQAFLVTYWLVSFIAFKFMLNVQPPLLVRLYLKCLSFVPFHMHTHTSTCNLVTM